MNDFKFFSYIYCNEDYKYIKNNNYKNAGKLVSMIYSVMSECVGCDYNRNIKLNCTKLDGKISKRNFSVDFGILCDRIKGVTKNLCGFGFNYIASARYCKYLKNSKIMLSIDFDSYFNEYIDSKDKLIYSTYQYNKNMVKIPDIYFNNFRYF